MNKHRGRLWSRVLKEARPTYGITFVLSLLFLFASSSTQSQTIWMGGNPRNALRIQRFGDGDFQRLFDADAPWPRASKMVSVLLVNTQYLLYEPDEKVRALIRGLEQRHIALAAATLMIPRREACGGNVEGYLSPGGITRMALRVKQLGGVLKYAAMDEPLWFGHYYHGPNACQSPVADIAQTVAENVRALRQVFPDIQIGDDEPFKGASRGGLTVADEMAFAEAYRAATGIRLAFVHADLQWTPESEGQLRRLKSELHSAGIRYGVIFDGDPRDESNIAWTENAENRFRRIQSRPESAPDDIIIQTWMVFPNKMLPETEPGTLTNLVLDVGAKR